MESQREGSISYIDLEQNPHYQLANKHTVGRSVVNQYQKIYTRLPLKLSYIRTINQVNARKCQHYKEPINGFLASWGKYTKSCLMVNFAVEECPTLCLLVLGSLMVARQDNARGAVIEQGAVAATHYLPFLLRGQDSTSLYPSNYTPLYAGSSGLDLG